MLLPLVVFGWPLFRFWFRLRYQEDRSQVIRGSEPAAVPSRIEKWTPNFTASYYLWNIVLFGSVAVVALTHERWWIAILLIVAAVASVPVFTHRRRLESPSSYSSYGYLVNMVFMGGFGTWAITLGYRFFGLAWIVGAIASVAFYAYQREATSD